MLIKDLKTASDEDKKLCIVEITHRLTAAYSQTAKWLVTKGFSSSVAEDAVQDAMVYAVKRLGSNLIEKPEAWLRTTAYHAAVKVKRRQLPLLDGEDGQEAKHEEDSAARDEVVQVVADAIRRLPAQLQEIVLLVHFEGMSLEAASQILGIHHGTAGRRNQKALEALRDDLGDFGGFEK